MTQIGLDLYNFTDDNASLKDAILRLRSDFEAHNHDGVSSRDFETLRAEVVSARAVSIRKIGFSDDTAGLWAGFVGATPKLYLGNASSNLKWSGTTLSITGTITATAGTIGGWTIGSTTLTGGAMILDSGGIITAGTIQTAASGERIVLTASTKKLELINSTGNTVISLFYGSATTAALMTISVQNNARRAVELIVAAALGTDAKAMTIVNASASITIDITDGGIVGLQIAACDNNAIVVSNAPTNGAGLDFTYASGDYPVIQLNQGGAATNSYGIKITQGAGALKEGLFIVGGANSNLAECIYLDRDGNSANDVHAMVIESNNAGAGSGVGINLSSPPFAFTFAVDANDPTGGGGAATGRIPVRIGGATRYLAYY